MNKESIKQQAAYAALEASRLSFAERIQKRSEQPLLMRLGKAAIGNFARPFVRAPIYIEDGKFSYKLINSGYENIVYASDNDVIKLNIRTLSSDKEKVDEEARSREATFNLCKQYLGNHWLDTNYGTREFLGGHVVQAKQPLLMPELVFSDVPQSLEYSDDPKYIRELESLFTAIGYLYTHTGYYPDILGKGNIAAIRNEFNELKIVILDTEPASPSAQEELVPNRNIVIGDEIRANLSLWGQTLGYLREQYESREVILH